MNSFFFNFFQGSSLQLTDKNKIIHQGSKTSKLTKISKIFATSFLKPENTDTRIFQTCISLLPKKKKKKNSPKLPSPLQNEKENPNRHRDRMATTRRLSLSRRKMQLASLAPYQVPRGHNRHPCFPLDIYRQIISTRSFSSSPPHPPPYSTHTHTHTHLWKTYTQHTSRHVIRISRRMHRKDSRPVERHR